MMVTSVRSASQSASRVFPADVGPHTTGIATALLPTKAALELGPRELDDRRAAMDIVRRKPRLAERDEQRAHLGRRELVPCLDRGLARDRGGEALVPRVRRRRAITRERGERLAQAAFGIEARMRHRHAADEQCMPTEPLDLEAETNED